MQMYRIATFGLVIVFLSINLQGCGTATFQPTSTPSATNTPMPTLTNTPTRTSTPSPTATPLPTLTPTPIPEFGKPISDTTWDITVFDAIYRERIAVNGMLYTPYSDYIFVDVGLKAKSLGSKTTVFSNDILIIDENGKEWPVIFYGHKAANGKEIDPFSIGPGGIDISFGYDIDVSTEQYFRFLIIINKTSLGSEIVFKFENLPGLPFTLKDT